LKFQGRLLDVDAGGSSNRRTKAMKLKKLNTVADVVDRQGWTVDKSQITEFRRGDRLHFEQRSGQRARIRLSRGEDSAVIEARLEAGVLIAGIGDRVLLLTFLQGPARSRKLHLSMYPSSNPNRVMDGGSADPGSGGSKKKPGPKAGDGGSADPGSGGGSGGGSTPPPQKVARRRIAKRKGGGKLGDGGSADPGSGGGSGGGTTPPPKAPRRRVKKPAKELKLGDGGSADPGSGGGSGGGTQ
jgi:hypothetical protein